MSSKRAKDEEMNEGTAASAGGGSADEGKGRGPEADSGDAGGASGGAEAGEEGSATGGAGDWDPSRGGGEGGEVF